MKFKLKNGSANTGPILTIEADKDDELAYVDAERVYRGDLDSFLPFSYDREGKSYEFSYFIGSGIALDRLLAAPLAPDVLRNSLGSLLHMMQVCEQNGLSRLRVVLEAEHVYYDPAMGMLRFAYVPVRSYVSEIGESGLISRICSARMADASDQEFAVSVWDFVHRTTILTSVALEDFLEGWGLQGSGSGRRQSRKAHSALGADTRTDHGWDFVTAIREDEARRQEEDRRRAEREAQAAAVAAAKAAESASGAAAEKPAPASGSQPASAGTVDESRDPRFDPQQPLERRFLLTRLSTGQGYLWCDGRHIIGRGADCSISLPDVKGASRQHVALDVQGTECVLHDLDSTNGVFMDGKRLDAGSATLLTSGSRFVLAEEEFLLE